MRSITKLAFGILLAAAIFTPQAHAQYQQSDRSINCDSTCVLQQQSMLALIPKANTFVAPTYVASPTPKPKCGPSAGSILPGAPNSFLCDAGTPSAVSTTTANGETTYSWTCSNSLGSQLCTANQREVGACGADNGKTLSSNPTNVCATGQSYGFNFANNQYTWGCAGNYGSPAMCSAAYAPPIPPSQSKTIYRYYDSMLPGEGGSFTSTYVPLSASEGYISSRESQGPWGRCRYEWQTASQERILPSRTYNLNGLAYWVISLSQWNSYTYWYNVCVDGGS
ncbi:hypothetical protein [Ralstonia solanacearum]|uniref:hypothetical protein n=1 Tax=Ralstonia solanacearum TaxID=305 RepID=UPI000AA66F73|nr:hypothetical protein [Ralstonia solanacearum]